MSYKPIFKDQTEEKKEPETPAAPAPNYEAELAAEKARSAAMMERMKEKEAEWDRRQSAIEEQQRLAQEQYNMQVQQADAQRQAVIDLGITEEEYAANPTATIQKVEQYMNALYQNQQETANRGAQVITGLAEDNHKLKMDALAVKDFYKYARSDIEDYYKKNPNAKIPGTPGYESPEAVYEKMVGRNWQGYYDKQAEEKQQAIKDNPPPVERQTYTETETPVRPGTPVGPSGPGSKKKEEVTLSPEEQAIFDHYNRLEGGKLFPGGPAEWKAISSGKVLPKKVGGASDWQRGLPAEYQVSTGDDE